MSASVSEQSFRVLTGCPSREGPGPSVHHNNPVTTVVVVVVIWGSAADPVLQLITSSAAKSCFRRGAGLRCYVQTISYLTREKIQVLETLVGEDANILRFFLLRKSKFSNSFLGVTQKCVFFFFLGGPTIIQFYRFCLNTS